MLLWGHFLDIICRFSRLADEVKIVQLVLAWQDLPDLLGDTARGIHSADICWWTSKATWLNYLTQLWL